MQELLIATSNPGKSKEIVEALKGLPYKFLFLGDLGVSAEGVIEDGETFSENAFKKAHYFAEKTGMLTLAEDSGILVDALLGELGVNTRRWGASEKASDEEWIEYFLKRMEGVSGSSRGARFECCACLTGGGIEKYFEGRTKGIITEKIMAPILRGLPLSSCFIPEGYDKVYAALSVDDKNKVSHRGKAMRKVREFLGL
jgi:XTP/dITP diphosphohydrolase